MIAVTQILIVSVCELGMYLQNERSLEVSVLCVFPPRMSRSIMRPELSPHKVLTNHTEVLINHIDYQGIYFEEISGGLYFVCLFGGFF